LVWSKYPKDAASQDLYLESLLLLSSLLAVLIAAEGGARVSPDARQSIMLVFTLVLVTMAGIVCVVITPVGTASVRAGSRRNFERIALTGPL
jgi:hypothetical protein